MKIKLSTFCTLILFVSVCTSTDIESSDDNIYLQTVIKKAVENQLRPEKDRQRDIDRKPFEVMLFSGIKSGDVVADIGSAGGYYTRILSDMVGPNGHIYGFNGKEFARIFNERIPNCSRIVNDDDIIPNLPSAFKYRHCNTVYYINDHTYKISQTQEWMNSCCLIIPKMLLSIFAFCIKDFDSPIGDHFIKDYIFTLEKTREFWEN